MSFDGISAKMREGWDARARENAWYFIVDSQSEWSESGLYALGQMTVHDDILNDMYNVCQGKEPGEMRVLAGQFGSVDAVEGSPEMVALAKRACADLLNVTLWNNNGVDLRVLSGQHQELQQRVFVNGQWPSHSVHSHSERFPLLNFNMSLI